MRNGCKTSTSLDDAAVPISVSVIMPVYNSEKYVAHTISSVLSQNADNFEVLAIDDGSTDSSGMILDEIASNDDRVRVYHRKNSGMCAARNFGIEMACGEFVMFCDNDDECLPGFIADNLALAQNARVDVVRFGRILQRIDVHDSLKRETTDCPPIAGERSISDLAIHPSWFYYGTGGVWTGLYRRSLLMDNMIRFDERLRHGYEDILFNIDVYNHASVVAFNKGSYYLWKRRAKHSSSMTLSEDGMLGAELVLAALDKQFNNCGLYEVNPSFCATALVGQIKDLLTVGQYQTKCSFSRERELYRRVAGFLEPYRNHLNVSHLEFQFQVIKDLLLAGRYRLLYMFVTLGVKWKYAKNAAYKHWRCERR